MSAQVRSTVVTPTDFGSGLVAEVVPFRTVDGLDLNLVHVQGGAKPTRAPVLLVHGAGVRANIFNPPERTTFVRYLIERGHDVWLENWRASIDVPASEWTLDQAAVFDHPAAVRMVVERTGVPNINAVIHCQGSTSFTMSALAGLVPQVRTIVSNAVSLHPVVPTKARIKGLLLLPFVAMITRYLDPRWGETPTTPVAKMLKGIVDLLHRECSNGVCKFASFTYGAGHPTLWRHENLSNNTHSWIKGEFADVPITFFQQMNRCLNQGHLVRTGALAQIPPDLTAQPPAAQMRFALVAGERNDCFTAESQRRTFSWLEQQAPGRHRLHVIPQYGHLDIFLGEHAARDTFPVMAAELEA